MTLLATSSRTVSLPAYGLASRGQCVTMSVKPSSDARPAASTNASTLLSE